jgi:hypothetical protein
MCPSAAPGRLSVVPHTDRIAAALLAALGECDRPTWLRGRPVRCSRAGAQQSSGSNALPLVFALSSSSAKQRLPHTIVAHRYSSSGCHARTCTDCCLATPTGHYRPSIMPTRCHAPAYASMDDRQCTVHTDTAITEPSRPCSPAGANGIAGTRDRRNSPCRARQYNAQSASPASARGRATIDATAAVSEPCRVVRCAAACQE